MLKRYFFIGIALASCLALASITLAPTKAVSPKVVSLPVNPMHAALLEQTPPDFGLSITGDTVTVVKKLPFSVVAPGGYDLYFWQVPPSVTGLDKGAIFDVAAAPSGTLTIGLKAIQVDWAAKKFTTKFSSITFIVGDVPPPVPPVPPVPPTPPEPPDPFASPYLANGLRCLIVYETADLNKMPKEQQLILKPDKELLDYLNSHCVQGKVNKDWRIWDKDVPTKYEDAMWQKVMARPRQSVPWIVIGNGKTGYEGPLPANEAKTIELLKKYGGA